MSEQATLIQYLLSEGWVEKTPGAVFVKEDAPEEGVPFASFSTVIFEPITGMVIVAAGIAIAEIEDVYNGQVSRKIGRLTPENFPEALSLAKAGADSMALRALLKPALQEFLEAVKAELAEKPAKKATRMDLN